MVLRDPYAKYQDLSREELMALAAKYDEQAEQKKTETITMRVTPRVLREVKRAAEKNGYPKYQQWVTKVLNDAIAATFPEEYADPGDDF